MNTKEKLTDMLKENTGIHMMDSGGAYGRHWQRNQTRDFDSEPAVSLHFGEFGIEATHNLYHWLAERLEYNQPMDILFHDFSVRPSNEDKSWLELIETFVEEIDGTDMETINTYNGEDALSQTIQYTRFEYDGNYYIILQVHNGADVRGGYSTPRVFTESDYMGLFDNARVSIRCTRSDIDPDQLTLPGVEREQDPHVWETYDAGYSWEPEDSSFQEHLEDYDISHDESDRGQGKLFVDADENGYCPICGSKLVAF